ncbi:MAG: Bug family tripartite tricarboxylate transporter substrate binding protein [Chloroflexota bacterium]
MNRLLFPLLAATLAATLLIGGCTQAAPSPTPAPAAKAGEPTKATAPTPAKAAEPTKAVEPTKAAQAPAKTDFPTKGKAITLIVPLPAGSSMDIGARVMAPMLEKDLGTPVQVVNKVGAGMQVGLTELALAKPDGYTIAAHALPATITLYLDPERKTTFSRTQLTPLALDNIEPVVISVKKESPFKTLKEVVDAAKANPEKVKASVSGVLVTPHLGALEFERVTGVKFGIVHFEGGVQGLTAMLGDNVDLDFNFPGTVTPMLKGDKIRVLGVMDSKEYSLLPGIKTAESQGYKAYMSAYRGYVAPGGMPKEIADALSGAIKKAAASDEYSKKMAELGIEVRFMDGAQTATYWADSEAQVKTLVDLHKKK